MGRRKEGKTERQKVIIIQLTNRQIDRKQTYKHTDIYTNRQTDREREKERERKREREREKIISICIGINK